MKIEKVAEVFKALADRSRLLVVNSLTEKPQYLEELAERLNLAVSTVSFHLKKLEKAGLVWKKKQQYYTIFSLKKELFTKTLEEYMSFEIDEKQLQEERINQYKEKILKVFMKDGKITQIPAQKQKRWIVFEQILNEFEYGNEYTEKEVNEIIQKYNEDHCSIRRSFIEENVMNRKDYVYSITENYDNFRKGKDSESTKHGMKESYEQSIRDKFGVS
jgi:ArsR family transcriptional regulator, arsenate/arsenite/antimonite-responsive transcriptional repressor